MGRAPTVVACRLIAAIVLGLAAVAGLRLASTPGRAEAAIETSIAPPPTMKPRAPARRPAPEAPVEEEAAPAPPERRPADATDEEDRDEAGDGRALTSTTPADGDMRAHAEAQAPL